jgi:hypothetical protein
MHSVKFNEQVFRDNVTAAGVMLDGVRHMMDREALRHNLETGEVTECHAQGFRVLATQIRSGLVKTVEFVVTVRDGSRLVASAVIEGEDLHA